MQTIETITLKHKKTENKYAGLIDDLIIGKATGNCFVNLFVIKDGLSVGTFVPLQKVIENYYFPIQDKTHYYKNDLRMLNYLEGYDNELFNQIEYKDFKIGTL